MKIYAENECYKLYQGNMLDMLEVIEPNSIDSIVADPPYELNFMGKGWDNSGIAFQKETWERCYEVLKPGGYLLAFGGSRTFHRIACAIEDAGFEIRDTIMWLYGSGFPKSMNLSKGLEAREKLGNAGTRNKRKVEQSCEGEEYKIKQTNNGAMGKIIETTRKKYVASTQLAKEWQGWGTCLKPSFEPIIIARKPFKGSLVDNVIEYGVGGLNIDECRVENTNADNYDLIKRKITNQRTKRDDGNFLDGLHDNDIKHGVTERGRFPTNTILTYDETDFSEVCGGFPKDDKGQSNARYFYCAKTSKKDRDEGLENFEEVKITNGCVRSNQETARRFGANSALKKNTHPTVKPTELMQYLVRLVTPNDGTVLDPFNGSGSTGKAVIYENNERNKGYKYIGIELSEEYLEIADARIKNASKDTTDKQMTIFDMGV